MARKVDFVKKILVNTVMLVMVVKIVNLLEDLKSINVRRKLVRVKQLIVLDSACAKAITLEAAARRLTPLLPQAQVIVQQTKDLATYRQGYANVRLLLKVLDVHFLSALNQIAKHANLKMIAKRFPSAIGVLLVECAQILVVVMVR